MRRVSASSANRKISSMYSAPRPLCTTAAAAILALLGASQAWAHARLTACDPATNATVSAPRTLHLEFSEALARKFSTVSLSDAGGHPVALALLDSKDARAMDAALRAPLAPGHYTVSWTAVSSDDGHRKTGSYSFTVR